ncbi:MAG: hypothetical protein F4066_08705 [Chloroflexi bacterium]|nr:hypothetical protein [Chloroflexota bacterium]MYF80186.1 hypothetical protein [Chloroflexota bacterium]MYI04919.1 hypothetical protein [Chloroflexota bacterium]
MSLFSRLRSRIGSDPESERRRSSLEEAEQLLRSGGAVAAIQQVVRELAGHNDVEDSWIALFRGDLDRALDCSYRTAERRPYDVDSRLVHGLVRLARNELDHAEHEFDAVIEEFGAEQEALDGRRAVILARGFAPLDEFPASESDWEAAAVLLTTLWRRSATSRTRMLGLRNGHELGIAIVQGALDRGLALDAESEDGSI